MPSRDPAMGCYGCASRPFSRASRVTLPSPPNVLYATPYPSLLHRLPFYPSHPLAPRAQSRLAPMQTPQNRLSCSRLRTLAEKRECSCCRVASSNRLTAMRTRNVAAVQAPCAAAPLPPGRKRVCTGWRSPSHAELKGCTAPLFVHSARGAMAPGLRHLPQVRHRRDGPHTGRRPAVPGVLQHHLLDCG